MFKTTVTLCVLAVCFTTASADTGAFLGEIAVGAGLGFGAFFATAYTGEKIDQDSDEVYLLAGIAGLAVGTAFGVWFTGEYLVEPSENRGETFRAALGGAAMGALPAVILYASALTDDEHYCYYEPPVHLIPFVIVAPAPVSTLFYNIVKKPELKNSDPAVCVLPTVTFFGGDLRGSRFTPGVGVSIYY